MIACVAVIARSNQPLLLRCYGDEQHHTLFHHICYCSVDSFEGREQTLRLGGAAAKGAELFLGMVMCMQEYKVYGYLTCTGVRVVVVLDDGDTKDDSTIGIFCKKLHHEYADAAMNPFYVAGQEIKSAKMDKELGLIVSQWNSDSSAK